MSSWVLSLACPAIIILAAYNGLYILAVFVAVAALASYLPWPYSSFLRSRLGGYLATYFSNTSLLYEEALEPASSKNLLCVHPHGIFALGRPVN